MAHGYSPDIFPNSEPQLFVAYYRVSTDKQGRSGLGLEAQINTVERHTLARGFLLDSFQEVESGKRSDRPELKKALELCRRKKAILVIAKLDRLARNVAFIANLMESRVEFLACDMPQANRLTLHIMAAMAEHEREAISQRTKEALAAAKARGRVLGNPQPDMATMTRRRSETARTFREDLYPRVKKLRDGGATLREIALELNERGIKGHHGGHWHPENVRRVLKHISS